MSEKDALRALSGLRAGADEDQRLLLDLIEQVWQIDQGVPAVEVARRMIAGDVAWFHPFVRADHEIDMQEQALLNQLYALKDRGEGPWQAAVMKKAEAASRL